MTRLNRIMQWDCFIPLGVFLALSAWVLLRMLEVCGQVVYPLDDPYIHAAMARHWAQHGIFGVSLYGFSATSSSPLWTAMLAFCFLIFGVYEWVPLALNIITSIVLILVLHHLISQWIANCYIILIFMLFMIFALPLITQTFTGMEHPLHTVLVLWLCQTVMTSKNHQQDSTIFLLAALAVLTRYESLFVVMPLCLILWMKGEWKRIAYLLLGALVPVVLLGCIYIAMGWYFFPNSIMVKSAINTQESVWIYGVLSRFYHQLFTTTHVTVLFLLAVPPLLWKLREENGLRNEHAGWLFVFITTAILHSAFASMGWFYRYEGYFLALGFISLSTILGEWLDGLLHQTNSWQQRFVYYGIPAVIIALILPPFQSNILSFQKIVPGAKNIYEQQYQMGQFLRQYYNGETVMANDIGAINFLADIYCLDLMGLGSMGPLEAGRQGKYSSAFTESWGKVTGAKIAVMYAGWWKEAIPSSWRLTGTWTVPEKVTVGDQTVEFFALEPSAFEPLAFNLIAFQNELPDGVEVKVFYP